MGSNSSLRNGAGTKGSIAPVFEDPLRAQFYGSVRLRRVSPEIPRH